MEKIPSMLIYFYILSCQMIFVKCTFVYTCPIGSNMNDRLITLRESLLCNRTLNCNYTKEMFTSAYHRYVIIVRTGYERWIDIQDAVDILSKCGIKNYIIQKSAANISQFCTPEKVTIVLTFSNTNLQFLEKNQPETSCTFHDVGLYDPDGIISNIVLTCPNTAWITGSNACDETLQQNSARLHHILDDNSSYIEFNMTRRLRIATVVYPVFLSNDSKNGTISYSGPIIELLERLANKLNFRYDLYPSIDNKYGIQNNQTKKWDGMMGMLERKEVDMIAAAITITESRSTLADFTTPFYYEPYSILIHKPAPANKLWNALSVFSPLVWVAILVSALIAILITFIVHKFAAKPADTGFEQIGGCVWYMTSGLVNQGCELEPDSWSGRNFLAFWWLYIVAIIAVYSGLLVAQLSTERTNVPFKDLTEFSKAASSGQCRFCIPESTVLHEAIQGGVSEDYRRLKSVIANHPDFIKTEAACKAWFKEEYVKDHHDVVFISEESSLRTVQRDNCKDHPMIVLSDRFQAGYFGFALQKGSPLKTILSIEITEAFDTGLILLWKSLHTIKQSIDKKMFCDIPTPGKVVGAETDSMAINEFFGSLTLLAIGISISLLALCLEIAFFFTNNRKVKKL